MGRRKRQREWDKVSHLYGYCPICGTFELQSTSGPHRDRCKDPEVYDKIIAGLAEDKTYGLHKDANGTVLNRDEILK